MTRRVRDATVTLSFGAKHPMTPPEGCVLCSDFPRVKAVEVDHYNPTKEPEGKKLEPHGPLPKTFEAFETLAPGMAEFLIETGFVGRAGTRSCNASFSASFMALH